MAVVMAQAGLYVPCASMTYRRTTPSSRIINRDDLFRGLSTFAMEMAELRTILLMNDRKSLILGDELCSGTENVSAISIFVAGLEQFVRTGRPSSSRPTSTSCSTTARAMQPHRDEAHEDPLRRGHAEARVRPSSPPAAATRCTASRCAAP